MVDFRESVHAPVDAEAAPEQDPIAKDDLEMPTSKSSKSPAFQFYARDFLASSKVEEMSMTERGIYITLLSRCWLDNGLPTEMKALAKYARMKTAQFERMWSNGTLHQCFFERSGKLHNERLDRERKIQAEFRRKQKERAECRWNAKPVGNATALPILGNALQSASASASASAEKHTRQSPIISRRRLDAAWEGAKGLYVPQRKHTDFVAIRNHSGADTELFAWYEQVAETWVGSPGGDMMKFWTARFDEKWPASGAASKRAFGSWRPSEAS